jgi:nitroimidazol reductase NimA-like FMN-containing flavoprotein (pyridoxamine 5'-phosphate oxidase superfamily)
MTNDAEITNSSLATLSRSECLDLLRHGCIGRLAVVVAGDTHVFPLNYAADIDGVIVFRTADLTTASKASLSNVAFEIDDIDKAHRAGWSVSVQGFAREISDAVDQQSQRLLGMVVHPWASGRRDRWFQITPKHITGRRLTTRWTTPSS